MIKGVEVQGLAEFSRRLKAAEPALAAELKSGLNTIAARVARTASTRVPRRSGRLAGSLRATSTPKVGKVTMGANAVPYAGFIEFGGRVGRDKSVSRPLVPKGRYLLPSYEDQAGEVQAETERLIENIAKRIG